MSLATFSRYESWLLKGAWVGVALVVFQACLLSFYFLRLPRETQTRDTSSTLTWRQQPGPAAQSFSIWDVFQKRGTGRAGISDPAKRFRLAGTFFVYQEGSPDTRKAVLDDLRDKAQRIVKENDDMGGVSVVRILRDSVLLRSSDGQEEELVLGFSATAGTVQGTAGQAGGQPSNRFGGRQIADKTWTFSRSALLDYYQELKDDPQRLVAVFDSLKPQYNDKRRIMGYRLGIEGEREFFDATGLKEGDTVLKVNETPMTSQRQAERFISDFVNGNANAFVLDVDRGGTMQKLIYQTK
jgi:type II secretory pathway component PulC